MSFYCFNLLEIFHSFSNELIIFLFFFGFWMLRANISINKTDILFAAMGYSHSFHFLFFSQYLISWVENEEDDATDAITWQSRNARASISRPRIGSNVICYMNITDTIFLLTPSIDVRRPMLKHENLQRNFFLNHFFFMCVHKGRWSCTSNHWKDHTWFYYYFNTYNSNNCYSISPLWMCSM